MAGSKTKNLKVALVSHKSLVARKAAAERTQAHKLAKQASQRTTTQEKKKAKRARAALDHPSETASAQSRQKGKQRATIPFDRDDSILLVGEANFSFALSLVLEHGHPAHQILATTFDSEAVCLTKYPDAEGNIARLRAKGVKVVCGIDAGALEKHKKVVGKKERWSRVIFNFPHVGKSPLPTPSSLHPHLRTAVLTPQARASPTKTETSSPTRRSSSASSVPSIHYSRPARPRTP
jgi:25S rRNA (uracil2634-N3)-methyltransferase